MGAAAPPPWPGWRRDAKLSKLVTLARVELLQWPTRRPARQPQRHAIGRRAPVSFPLASQTDSCLTTSKLLCGDNNNTSGTPNMQQEGAREQQFAGNCATIQIASSESPSRALVSGLRVGVYRWRRSRVGFVIGVCQSELVKLFRLAARGGRRHSPYIVVVIVGRE